MAVRSYDRPKYFELIDGRRYAKVSPQRTHALLQAWLLERVRASASGQGEVGTEWKFYLGGLPGLKNALQPDVSFISFERLATLTRAQAEKPYIAPDVAFEILSPGDRPGLLRTKIARYLERGAVAVVIVDPAKRTVAVHSSGGTSAQHAGETFANELVPWLTFAIDELFDAARWRGGGSE